LRKGLPPIQEEASSPAKGVRRSRGLEPELSRGESHQDDLAEPAPFGADATGVASLPRKAIYLFHVRHDAHWGTGTAGGRHSEDDPPL
jgi:hypothetical protein